MIGCQNSNQKINEHSLRLEVILCILQFENPAVQLHILSA